jgi:hypothetical protein
MFKDVLFLGGPLDGKKRSVNVDCQHISVKTKPDGIYKLGEAPPNELEYFEYTRHGLLISNETLENWKMEYVYIYNGADIHLILKDMIDLYSKSV